MARALVLGVNGQDGSYLAQALLTRGDQVVGVGRQAASRYVQDHPRFTYTAADLADERQVETLVHSVAPERIYHFAAVHGPTGSGFAYEPVFADMLSVNVTTLQLALEYARTHNPDARIFYAGSCKVFSSPFAGQIDEASPMQVSCLYSLGKLAARDLMRLYARDHGIQATNLILFNHDSPRRPADYLLPMLAQTIARAKVDPRHTLRVRTLDFWADWSAAEELMEIVADLRRTVRTGGDLGLGPSRVCPVRCRGAVRGPRPEGRRPHRRGPAYSSAGVGRVSGASRPVGGTGPAATQDCVRFGQRADRGPAGGSG
jgi:GDPmannose 4,6-dehydratase